MEKITPKEYFEKQFRNDFYVFIKRALVRERDNDLYISIQNLNPKLLAHIPTERRHLFYFSLAFVNLIDIIMSSYFPLDYPEFQSMTQYPKFEYPVSGLRVLPWKFVELDMRPATFKIFARYFLDDQRKYFRTHVFKRADWKSVIQAMLADTDLQGGRAGEIFISVLKEHVLN